MLRECVTLPGLPYSLLTIPKVAATAMRRALLIGNGVELTQGQVHRHPALIKLSTSEALKRGPVYAFVRHPLDRLVSCWADRIAGDKPSEPMMALGYVPGETFAAFVRGLQQIGAMQNVHTAPQTAFVERGVRWHQIEDAKAAWPVVMRETGLPPLEHCNRSKHSGWRDHFDAETLEIAQAVYRDDFKAFGYAG